MQKLIFSVLIIAFSHYTYAETLTLPEPKGSYGVGTLNVELSDPSRTQLRSNATRRWMATVFYPAYKTNSMYAYMPGTLKDGVVCGVKVLGHAIPNAEKISAQKFPLIISFPGRGGERQKETILYEALASHGYIVITMDQPYVASFVKLADDRKMTLTLKDAWNLPRARDYRYVYDDKVIAAAIKDIDFLLQNLHAFANLSSSFDTTKIILMGHSIGGNTAHIKGFSDSRIKAVVDIDSKITERKIYGHLGVPQNSDAKPVLFIRGMLQYQEEVGDQLAKIANSTIWSPHVQHSAFSDDAYFAAKIPNYGMGSWQSFYNWVFVRGPHFSSIDTHLGSYQVDEWFREYPEYIAIWLDKHLDKSSG